MTSSTQYLFFTGKGGVGKTSLSCATAVKMADEGKKVLLVSTDPASNLQDVLDSPVTEKVQPVKGLTKPFSTQHQSRSFGRRISQSGYRTLKRCPA